MVDKHLAILEPKPHLYTFFTFKNTEGTFTAGIGHTGTVCDGYIAELYGDKVKHYAKESRRTSIIMYHLANEKDITNDLNVAAVTLLC